jgi:poly-gamma-glutamate capsule biosynthesis protein CapA/YwtB (metallophosphatase superfamily)
VAGHRRSGARSRVPFAFVVLGLTALAAGALYVRTLGDSPTTAPRPVASKAHGPATSVPPTPAPSARGSSPAPSPAPPHRGRLLIHGAGDTNFDPSYIPNLQTYGWAYALSGLDGLFQRDDLTVANFECAVSNLGAAVPKTFNFRCDPDALPALKAGGIEVGNLANNHSYDYGPDAVVDSRRNLEQAGIAPVGAGKDTDEAIEPALFEIKGWKVAVVGIDEVVDPYPEAVATAEHPGTACGHDVGCMMAEIREAARQSDLVVVDIHWGVELDTQPRDYQVEQAHQFIAAGADIIFGGHSHRLQPLTVYKGKPIFWSLGNFVWPAFSVEGSTTAVAEVVVKPDGAMTARLIPAYIASSGHPVLRAG